MARDQLEGSGNEEEEEEEILEESDLTIKEILDGLIGLMDLDSDPNKINDKL